MTKEDRDRITSIFERSLYISDKTPADVFFTYFPHTESFSFNVYLKGWWVDRHPDYNQSMVYLPDNDLYDEARLKGVENMLSCLEVNYGLKRIQHIDS